MRYTGKPWDSTQHTIQWGRRESTLTICTRSIKEWQSVHAGNSVAIRHSTICSKAIKSVHQCMLAHVDCIL